MSNLIVSLGFRCPTAILEVFRENLTIVRVPPVHAEHCRQVELERKAKRLSTENGADELQNPLALLKLVVGRRTEYKKLGVMLSSGVAQRAVQEVGDSRAAKGQHFLLVNDAHVNASIRALVGIQAQNKLSTIVSHLFCSFIAFRFDQKCGKMLFALRNSLKGMAEGLVDGKKPARRMSAAECFDVGKWVNAEGNSRRALEWLLRAVDRCVESDKEDGVEQLNRTELVQLTSNLLRVQLLRLAADGHSVVV